MTNCMIQSKGLSLQFWVEAINCANYIANHIPTKYLQGVTTEESWSKIKPNVSHFRVFASEGWAHIQMKNKKHCSLKVKSTYLMDIMKM